MTYAQEYGGQRLHLVDEGFYPDGSRWVSNYALCGRHNGKRGGWRMTINVPLAHACKNCRRIYAARVREWRQAS